MPQPGSWPCVFAIVVALDAGQGRVSRLGRLYFGKTHQEIGIGHGTLLG